jgi:hypothetical protein
MQIIEQTRFEYPAESHNRGPDAIATMCLQGPQRPENRGHCGSGKKWVGVEVWRR